MVNKTAGCNTYYTISAAAKSLGVAPHCSDSLSPLSEYVVNSNWQGEGLVRNALLRILGSCLHRVLSVICNMVDILQYGVPPFIIMRRGEVG